MKTVNLEAMICATSQASKHLVRTVQYVVDEKYSTPRCTWLRGGIHYVYI